MKACTLVVEQHDWYVTSIKSYIYVIGKINSLLCFSAVRSPCSANACTKSPVQQSVVIDIVVMRLTQSVHGFEGY